MDNILMTGGELLKFLELLEQHGGTPEHVQRVLGSGLLNLLFDEEADISPDYETRAKVRAALGLAPEFFTFSFDQRKSIETMIDELDLPFLNLVSDGRVAVLENFHTSGTGIVEYQACYFQFNEEFSDERKPIRRIESYENPPWSWFPAKPEHLLTFAKIFPEEQRRMRSIMGLGSVAKIKGEKHALRVCKMGGFGRPSCLSLENISKYQIQPRTRLLAIREIPTLK